MLLLIIFLVGVLVAAGTGVLAAYSDVKGLTIPNLYSAIIGSAFIVTYALLWIFGAHGIFSSLGSHVLAALIVFGITAGMFAMKGLGAADSKLATVYALWTGLGGLMAFIFYMALIGGVLGLVGLYIRKYKPFKIPQTDGWVDRLQKGESKVPYGVAIVGGVLASFVKIGYFSGDVLASFLS